MTRPLSRSPAVSDRTVRTVAENLIRAAAERGELDGLPGAGKPLPGLDEPYDPDWWIKKWVRREHLGRELGEALRKLRGER